MPRTMSRVALSLFAAALLSTALASCGSDLLNLDQSWTLTTVRDSTLPYTVPNASQNRVITSGVADLHSDNTYTVTFTGTVDGSAGQLGTDSGHWAITNTTFIFHSATAGDYIAALQGNTFHGSIPGQFVGSSDATIDMRFAKQ